MSATRKFMLPVLLLALLLWSSAALAFPNAPYPEETCPAYARLAPELQTLVDLLYATIVEEPECIKLPKGTPYDDAQTAIRFVIEQFPELCNVDRYWRTIYYLSTPDIANSIFFAYSEADSAQLLARAREMTAGMTGSDYVRELALHDALCKNVVFDQSAPYRYTAYGALCEGRAVCEGYAQAFILLLRLSGIPAEIIIGNAWGESRTVGGHAWVCAEISGIRCLVDPTWNDCSDQLFRCYFNLSAEQMGMNHVPDPGYETPEAVSNYEWFYLSSYAAANQVRAEIIFCVQLAEMARGSTDRACLRAPDIRPFIEHWEDYLERYSVYGSCQLFYDIDQNCLMVTRTP